MHGCAEGHVVYGWHEDDRNTVIDLDSADIIFDVYFDEQVKDTGCTPIYGLKCKLDKTTGKAVLDEESKDFVEKAFNRYKKLKESGGIKVKSEVGYFVGIQGNMEHCLTKYALPLLGEQKSPVVSLRIVARNQFLALIYKL